VRTLVTLAAVKVGYKMICSGEVLHTKPGGSSNG
jgi:hypothetical protein